MTNPIIHVALASLILVPASCWIARNFARGSRGSKLSAEPLVPPSQAVTPFTFSRLDHIVLRCRDVQAMLDFYVGVLGAEPVWVGRFGGCLSHLRIGSSLIDLQSYRSPEGRRFHAGGTGLPAGAPLPEMDAEAGTLDHFAINLKPFDPVAVSDYLRAQGCSPFAEGQRYGADGEGYSMYLRDPESNVVELKCGASENE
mmetsp:Transcript_7199/g.14752  ORF Transcript_7199/g.14752 Transcript_7199/m.14752 type:complete len:199 (-) Transcript_7199:376-972(-)